MSSASKKQIIFPLLFSKQFINELICLKGGLTFLNFLTLINLTFLNFLIISIELSVELSSTKITS